MGGGETSKQTDQWEPGDHTMRMSVQPEALEPDIHTKSFFSLSEGPPHRIAPPFYEASSPAGAPL